MINKIKSRKDFIRIQRNGKKVVSSCLIIQHLKSIDDENPKKYDDVTAHDFLIQRLKDIGVL